MIKFANAEWKQLQLPPILAVVCCIGQDAQHGQHLVEGGQNKDALHRGGLASQGLQHGTHFRAKALIKHRVRLIQHKHLCGSQAKLKVVAVRQTLSDTQAMQTP